LGATKFHANLLATGGYFRAARISFVTAGELKAGSMIDLHLAVWASALRRRAAIAISAAMNLISALSPAYRSTSTKRIGADGAPRLVSQFNEFSEFLGTKCTYSRALSIGEYVTGEPGEGLARDTS
jgi:hypothetical protein